jgi:hypothetical protein
MKPTIDEMRTRLLRQLDRALSLGPFLIDEEARGDITATRQVVATDDTSVQKVIDARAE